MARKFLTSIDFGWLEALKLRLQNLAADPSSPAKGWIYMHSSDNRPKVHDGSSFRGLAYADEVSGSYSDENARDAMGNALVGGTGVTVTPNDGADTITIATTITQYTDTMARANRLDQFAAPTSPLGMNGQKVTSVADPTSAQDAATKSYVDAARSGLAVKDPVRVASTGNLAVASALTNGSTIDGVAVATGDRVLLKNQTTASENGIYVVVASGAASRATDADTAAELVPGTAVWVNEGTANGDARFVLTTNGPITLGTTSLAFTKDFQASDIVASTGLSKSGSTLSIDTAVVVRKFVADIGDGTSTTIHVDHNLGTKDVIYSVRQNSDDVHVECDAVSTSTSRLDLAFAVAPGSNALRITVHA